jgi:signal transduction protein with GAF and PtsI domain
MTEQQDAAYFKERYEDMRDLADRLTITNAAQAEQLAAMAEALDGLLGERVYQYQINQAQSVLDSYKNRGA